MRDVIYFLTEIFKNILRTIPAILFMLLCAACMYGVYFLAYKIFA